MQNQSDVKISMEQVCVLLVGFNRPELLKKRLDEIENSGVDNLYISIDGGIQSNTTEMDLLKLNAQKKFSKLKFFELKHHSSNLGLVRHLTGEISNVLSRFQYIIVIEDDIRVSKSFMENMINGLNIHKNNKTNGIVGGFSPLHFKFMKNSWRISRYPFIWGWACSSTTWQGYRYDISSDNLKLKLLESSTWTKLNSSQKLKWLNLFKQVQSNPLGTWDIQLTYLSYCKNFVNILPVFSLIGNEGFNDFRAVHTKGKKPKFVTISNLNNSVISRNKLREMRILNFFDKLWMNDF